MFSRCQSDAYERSYTATVSTVIARSDGFVDVVLDETILYPEGGGQPADRGTLDGLEVLHVEHDSEGRILHRLSRAPRQQEVELLLDWTTRYERMQQHTAQHLLTAIAAERFGVQTIAFHLGEELSHIDVDRKELDDTVLQAILDEANAAIRANLSVRIRFVSPEQYRLETKLRSRGLPEGHQGEVRLVEIERLDLNTCGGTHVSSLAELQLLTVVAREAIKGGTRLFYVAGERARRRLDALVAQVASLNKALSCGPSEHLAALSRLDVSARTAERERKSLLLEFATAEAARLAASEEVLLCWHRENAELPLLGHVARELQARRPDALMLLTASPSGAPRQGVFLVAGPEALVKAHGARVAQALEGKGGGSGGRFQGKAERIDARETAAEMLRAALASS
ncbi:MAG: alanyl-tRNA editing protein [Myxococcota bacterium]|jgi:Ser-tRNA(Ala) deacylase AlaX|nr:alanyl-tRNA editing protein [Myxococcota bacterium]